MTGEWSGGYSGTSWCTTENGQCTVTTGNISKRKTSVTFTVKKGGDQPRDFELKVAVDDSEGAHLEATRCIHYEGRCRHTRRRSPPYEAYLAQWAT